MKNMLGGATFLLVGAGTAGVVAQLPEPAGIGCPMEDVTQYMLAPSGSPFCPGTTGLVYLGGGSTGGELAMTGTYSQPPLNNPTQSIAPMTRTLVNAVCNTKQGNPGTAANRSSVSTVWPSWPAPGTRLPPPAATSSSRRPATTGATSCAWFTPAPARATSTVPRDCARPERVALVDNWGSLFNAPCVGTANCTQLRHAFRRADLSGTTDTFLSLLGLPTVVEQPVLQRRRSDPAARRHHRHLGLRGQRPDPSQVRHRRRRGQ